MQEDAANNREADSVDEAEETGAQTLPLSRRTLLLIAAGVGALILLVVVAVGVYRSMAAEEAARAARQKAQAVARAAAAKDAAIREASRPLVESARQANAAIMSADTEVPPPVIRLPKAAGPAAISAVSAVAGEAPAPTAAQDAKPVADGATSKNPAAADTDSAIGPEGCKLSGDSPRDFGKALGRCLEEFNRIDGR